MEFPQEDINNIGGYVKNRIDSIEEIGPEMDEETRVIPVEYKDEKISHNFSIIYHGLSQKFNLSPTESVLIALVYALSHGKGFCYMGVGSFSKLLNVSEMTIHTNLKKLNDVGLIENGSKDLQYKTVKRRLTPIVINEIEKIKKSLENKKVY